MPAPDLEQFAKILSEVNRPGDFCAQGRRAFSAPRLRVDGVGPLALPLLPEQARALIAVAEVAPYGRGSETLIDTRVRRAWQINPQRLQLNDARWDDTVKAVTAEMAAALGVSDPVEAQLYKMMLYDQGSFFVDHRDTEKVRGMFGTLVVVLPSLFEGGELVVKHEGREVVMQLPGDDPGEIAYAAFYADCVHELRPVTAGVRAALIYNLVRAGKGKAPRPPEYSRQKRQLVRLMSAWREDEDRSIKLAYPLSHEYTEAEMSWDTLKGADAAVAEVVAEAAREADCTVYLAMISVYETGSAMPVYSENRRYGRYSYDDEDEDEEFEVVSCDERSASLSRWFTPGGDLADLGVIPLLDEEISPPGALDPLNPDEQRYMEATGNGGASYERTYRAAALVLWPAEQIRDVLAQGGLPSMIPFLRDLSRRWAAEGEADDSPTWQLAHSVAMSMFSRAPRAIHLDLVAAWLANLIALRDAEALAALFTRVLGWVPDPSRMEKDLLAACALMGWRVEPLQALVQEMMRRSGTAAMGLVGTLLSACPAGRARKSLASALVNAVVSGLPGQTPPPELPAHLSRKQPVNAEWMGALLRVLALTRDAGVHQRAITHILEHRALFPMDRALIPALLALTTEQSGPVADAIRAEVLVSLRARIAEPLRPPLDWARPAALPCRCADCQAVEQFLAHPTTQIYTFKAAEHRREHVLAQLSHAYDLTRETLRKGTPRTLILTKNNKRYEDAVAQRERDLRALDALAKV